MTTETIAFNRVKFLKADGESSDRIGGYLVRFTGPEHRDLYGEYFTRSTDYALDRWPIRPLMYQHGFDSTLRDYPIGRIDTIKADEIGLWAEAQLEMHHEYMAQIRWLIEQGALGWSSGALPQGVYVDEEGEIKRWPIIEGSLTPTPAEPLTVGDVTYMPPENMRAVGGGYVYEPTAEHVTNAYRSAGIDLDMPGILELVDAIKRAPAAEDEGEIGHDGDNVSTDDEQPMTESNPSTETQMSEKDIATLIAEELTRQREQEAAAQHQAELEAKAKRAEELEARLAELEEKMSGDQQPAKRLPARNEEPPQGGEQRREPLSVTVGSKFDALSPIDMAHGLMIYRGMAEGGRKEKAVVTEQYAKAFAEKLLANGIRPMKPDGTPYKTDELVYSTQSGYGDEWVPDLWSSELWRKARVDNVILPQFRAIDMPSNPFEIPAQGADPTVNYVGETTDEGDLTISGSGAAIPDSKFATGKVQLSAKKLALRVGMSAEFVEDSIIPVLPVVTEQSLRAMADAIDNVLLNGDTTNAATGNINSDDGDPTDTNKYLAFDGLRHLGLVTTTAQAVDCAGSPTVAKMWSTLATMPARYNTRINDLAWIVDSATHIKLMNDGSLFTVDKYGPNATVATGEVGKVGGVPVLVSAEMPLTEADGKVSTTSSNNTKGQAVLVYRPGWMVGYRRRVSASMTFIPYYDAYQMVATIRLAFKNFDNYVAAVLYNITV